MDKLPGSPTPPATPAPVAANPPPDPNPPGGGRDRGGSGRSTPEQRAKWREKAARRAARLRDPGGPPLPSAIRPDPAGPGGPAPGGGAGGPAPVPWSTDTLKPLFQQLVPALEEASVQRLAAKAAAIDKSLAAEVTRDAAWNSAAKVGVIEAGPQCAAEMLNEMGIGADKAHWAALLIAGGSIAASHMMLSARLERMLAERGKPDAGGVGQPTGSGGRPVPPEPPAPSAP